LITKVLEQRTGKLVQNSRNGFVYIQCMLVIITFILSAFLNGCKDESEPNDNNPSEEDTMLVEDDTIPTGQDTIPTREDTIAWPEEDIILDVLFADAEEFKYIFPGYSEGDSGVPWGFKHLGLDLITAINGAQVLAPAGGLVEEVNIYMNPRNNQWQVNVRVVYNKKYIYHVLFEPRAPSEEEIALQFAAIPVSVGQRVIQGDLLGKILDLSHGDLSGGEAGIHFDLRENEVLVCPGYYFNAEAHEKMLTLLWGMFPGAEICYP